MNDSESNVYMRERRGKLEQLRALGIEPYGLRQADLLNLARVREMYQPEMGHDGGPVVAVAGRIILKRDMGKLSFMTLRDHSGDLQVALDKKRLDEKGWAVNELLDLGDLVSVRGALGVTRKGEITIWATEVLPAAKALLPPPAKWEGLEDVELRYRQRYVDLWANPGVMKLAKLRIAVLELIRHHLREQGYVEVETPMMQPLAGGAAAKPFATHHNALDIPLYLRIAPELYLKRLLVGGFPKVFELNRSFRNEGISPRHNPEFTMLEAYEAFGDWRTMADLVEAMICRVAEELFGGLLITHPAAEGRQPRVINLTRPWRRVRMDELVQQRTGWQFDKLPLQQCPAAMQNVLDQYAQKLGLDGDRQASGHYRSFVHHLETQSPAEQLQQVYEKLIEPTLIDPCFVTHVPSVIIPLARESREDAFFADVYELAINGVEISPGYTELNDPEVQEKHFRHQVGQEDEKQKIDEDFLDALRYGMPPAGGMGLGIDRLIMMLSGAESIRDVILFPLLKPRFNLPMSPAK